MAEVDIKVYGTLVPVNKEHPQSPVTDIKYVKGGYRSVADVTERNRYANPADLQIFSEPGMIVYVQNEKQCYQLGNDLISWSEWPSREMPVNVKLKYDLVDNDPAIILNDETLMTFKGKEGILIEKKDNALEVGLNPKYVIDEGDWNND
jgi:hypothetical protein